MRLSDVVSGAGLSIYAQIALLIAFAGFVLLLVHLFTTGRDRWQRLARLPLEEPATPRGDSQQPPGAGGA